MMISRISKILLSTSIAVVLSGCGILGTTVKPGQMGIKNIVLRKPALSENTKPEGFYWQFPWNSMVTYDVT
jgi:hypothetical protein